MFDAACPSGVTGTLDGNCNLLRKLYEPRNSAKKKVRGLKENDEKSVLVFFCTVFLDHIPTGPVLHVNKVT